MFLGLSRDPANSTHSSLPIEPDLPPTDLTSLAVSAGFVPPKLEFGESDVGFPSPESDQTDLTDPQDFRWYLVDSVRSRSFLLRSWRDFDGSSQDLAKKWPRLGRIWRNLKDFGRLSLFSCLIFTVFTPVFAVFWIFDPNQPAHCPLMVWSTRSDYFGGRRQLHFFATWFRQVGSKLGTNPTRIDLWTALVQLHFTTLNYTLDYTLHLNLFECMFCTLNYDSCYTLHHAVKFAINLDGNIKFRA